MNQTIISNVVSNLFEDLNGCDTGPPYPAPCGFKWQKEADEYDPENDMIWEGNWNLIPENQIECFSFRSKLKVGCLENCKWKCPNGHMEDHFCYQNDGGYDMWCEKNDQKLIEQQQKSISNTLNPDYHVCAHKTHTCCTNSPCCDIFWHDGDCVFVSDVDGEYGGFAVRFGNQN